jgi:hypothetical protein
MRSLFAINAILHQVPEYRALFKDASEYQACFRNDKSMYKKRGGAEPRSEQAKPATVVRYDSEEEEEHDMDDIFDRDCRAVELIRDAA